jgi:hypothetical protein
MKRERLYLCEGYDPFFGPIREMVRAVGSGEAASKFYQLHGLVALHVSLEK